jgi:serine/threonine-protein kinase
VPPRPGGFGPPPRTTGAFDFKDRRWWLIGGAVGAVLILVVVLVVANVGGDDSTGGASATSSRVPAGPTTTLRTAPSTASSPPAAPLPPPPPPAPAPVVDPAALPGLLLSADQISQRMGVTGMTGKPVVHNQLLPANVTPPNCTGAYVPTVDTTYAGSGYTASEIQSLNLEPTHKVFQAVVAFPDPVAAKSFYDRQVADWNACKFVHVIYVGGGSSTEATLSVPATNGGVLTLMIVPSTSPVPGMQCERAMTPAGNVIVDVRACSPSVGAAGWMLALDIAEKVTGHR